jgi:NAD(P)-dependent dehydrogenase (short-subunit alcohol dehydrogenase family)
MGLSKLHPVVCDVTDYASLVLQRERIVGDIERNGWPPIIALVSNAGICNWLPLEMAVAEGICYDELDVNLIGHLNFLAAFVGVIRSNKCRLIYVSSGAATVPLPDRFRYSASKIGGEYITKGLGAELNVESFVLRPKLTSNTQMLRKDIDKAKVWMAKYKDMSRDHEGWWRTFSRLIERYEKKDVTTMGTDVGLVSAKILECVSLVNPEPFVAFYKITWSKRLHRAREALFDSF